MSADHKVLVRILNGYHRGAEIELASGETSIGAADESGIPLSDPGLLGTEAVLLAFGKRVALLPTADGCRDDRGLPITATKKLRPGSGFSIRGIGFSIARVGDPWPSVAIGASSTPGDIAVPTEVGSGTHARTPGAYDLVARISTVFGIVLLVAAVVGWLLDSPGLAVGARSVDDLGPGSSGPAIRRSPRSPVATVAEVPNVSPAATATSQELSSSSGSSDAGSPLSEERAFLLLVRGLRDLELAERAEVRTLADGVEVRTSVDGEDRAALERLVNRLRRDSQERLRIRIVDVPPAKLLPFEVTSVIQGETSAVVVDGSMRLQVGDTYKGFRLSAVETGRILFDGPRRVEIPW